MARRRATAIIAAAVSWSESDTDTIIADELGGYGPPIEIRRCGPPGRRRFSVTVKVNLKIAAVIAAIG
jgi:hypothetical protein